MASARYLIVFIVVVILRVSLIDCDTQALIATVCQSTEDRGFCTRVFNQNIKSPDTNMRGLSEIALDQGINNATDSAQYAKELSYKVTDQNLKTYLINCAIGYATTLGGLQNGQFDLQQSKFDDMVTVLLSAAKSQAKSCDVQPSFGKNPNPIYERNREMRILVSMAVATAFELKGGTPAGKVNLKV